jgi:pantoate--beta-alanine ligase
VREATGIEEIRRFVRETKDAGQAVAFVPTMGSLHEGHMSLVRLAKARGAAVVLSIFVNPTQFAPGEDYESYPRDLDRDREIARREGVDCLFVPSLAEMYPRGFQTKVTVPGLASPLCGRGRPGHFDGVALVVAKLLNIVRPDFAVFGMKDAQQAILIQQLARDLHLPGEIVLAPTVREKDGLAMSSRNAYLRPQERQAALAISRGLFRAQSAYRHGERAGAALVAAAREEIEREPLLTPEYVEIVNREDLSPWKDASRPALLAVAVRVGQARLIDNVILEDGGR